MAHSFRFDFVNAVEDTSISSPFLGFSLGAADDDDGCDEEYVRVNATLSETREESADRSLRRDPMAITPQVSRRSLSVGGRLYMSRVVR